MDMTGYSRRTPAMQTGKPHMKESERIALLRGALQSVIDEVASNPGASPIADMCRGIAAYGLERDDLLLRGRPVSPFLDWLMNQPEADYCEEQQYHE